VLVFHEHDFVIHMDCSRTTVENLPDPCHRHVPITRPEDRPVQERTSHGSERRPGTRPCIARVPMSVLVRLDVRHTTVGVHVSEPLVNFDRFVVRTEVDCRSKHLNNVVRLKSIDRILDPVWIQERNVRVDPRDVIPVVWKRFDSDVDQLLFHPDGTVRPVLDVFPDWEFREFGRSDEFRDDEPDTLDVTHLVNKLDEQFLTSSEPTVVEIWEDDVKNFLGNRTTVPH
jgi:hypothetical protein